MKPLGGGTVAAESAGEAVAARDEAAFAADVETVKSGMTKEPSCMRSGPEKEVEVGVEVSHSHESKDDTGRGGC